METRPAPKSTSSTGGKGSERARDGRKKKYRRGLEEDGDEEEASPAVSNANTNTPRSGSDSSASPGSGSGSTAAMTLTPSLWKLVERGDRCPFPDCAFTVSMMEERARRSSGGGKGGGGGEGAEGGGGAGGKMGGGRGKGSAVGEGTGDAEGEGGGELVDKTKSRCRHFHTLCGCRHTRGALKGLLFQVWFALVDFAIF